MKKIIKIIMLMGTMLVIQAQAQSAWITYDKIQPEAHLEVFEDGWAILPQRGDFYASAYNYAINETEINTLSELFSGNNYGSLEDSYDNCGIPKCPAYDNFYLVFQGKEVEGNTSAELPAELDNILSGLDEFIAGLDQVPFMEAVIEYTIHGNFGRGNTELKVFDNGKVSLVDDDGFGLLGFVGYSVPVIQVESLKDLFADNQYQTLEDTYGYRDFSVSYQEKIVQGTSSEAPQRLNNIVDGLVEFINNLSTTVSIFKGKQPKNISFEEQHLNVTAPHTLMIFDARGKTLYQQVESAGRNYTPDELVNAGLGIIKITTSAGVTYQRLDLR